MNTAAIPDKIRCGKCGMTFRVQPPLTSAAQWERCAEPGCGRRFWSALTHPYIENGYGAPKSSVVCGVDPKECEEF